MRRPPCYPLATRNLESKRQPVRRLNDAHAELVVHLLACVPPFALAPMADAEEGESPWAFDVQRAA